MYLMTKEAKFIADDPSASAEDRYNACVWLFIEGIDNKDREMEADAYAKLYEQSKWISHEQVIKSLKELINYTKTCKYKYEDVLPRTHSIYDIINQLIEADTFHRTYKSVEKDS